MAIATQPLAIVSSEWQLPLSHWQLSHSDWQLPQSSMLWVAVAKQQLTIVTQLLHLSISYLSLLTTSFANQLLVTDNFTCQTMLLAKQSLATQNFTCQTMLFAKQRYLPHRADWQLSLSDWQLPFRHSSCVTIVNCCLSIATQSIELCDNCQCQSAWVASSWLAIVTTPTPPLAASFVSKS